MTASDLKKVIYDTIEALQTPLGDFELHAVGNRIHLIVDNEEFEIVIRKIKYE